MSDQPTTGEKEFETVVNQLDMLTDGEKEWVRSSHNAALDAAIAEAVIDAKLRERQLAELLREAHQRLGNTAFPSLSARIAAVLARVKEGQ